MSDRHGLQPEPLRHCRSPHARHRHGQSAKIAKSANSDKLGQLCFFTSRHRPHHGFRPFRLRTLARALKSVGRLLGRAWVAEAWLQFKKGPTLGI